MKFAGSLVQYTCTKFFYFTGILLGADLVNKRAEHLFATRTCWRKVLQFLLTKDFLFFLCYTNGMIKCGHRSKCTHFCQSSLIFADGQVIKSSSFWQNFHLSDWFWTNSVTMRPESSTSESVALLWVQDKIMGHLQCYKYMSILNCPSRESWMHNAIFIS